jgi:PAS domain S-box-containing protein
MNTNNEDNFRNFFNDINDFLFVLDLDGNIIEINKAVETILGYTKEDLFGKSVLLVHPEEFRNEAQDTVSKMIEGTKESCPIPLITKSNVYIPVETRVYFGNWDGQKALIGVSRNLTELALSESKFHQVFNHSKVLMAISEIESGVFVNVNDQFLETLGYTLNEVVGKKSSELKLFTDSNQRNDIIKRIYNNEKVENENTFSKTKSGEILCFLFSATKIKIQTTEYLLTSSSDITNLINIKNKLKHNLLQQTLLADISQNLNSINNIENKINDTLKLLGEHTNVSRVYIFEDDSSGLITNNTYEWCNSDISSQKDELQGIPYEVIPSWKKLLVEKGKVFSTNIKELPDDLYVILEPQEIKSILVLPLFVHGKFYGFMGFDECKINKNWESDEIDLLRTISNIISNTFERMLYQKQLSSSEAQLKRAIENTGTGLWDWNIVTGEVYYNEVWCSMLGYDQSEIEPNVSTWEKLIHPSDMPIITEVLEKHMAGELDGYETIHRLKTKSGKWKWVLDKGRIVEWDETGKPLRAIGTHTDLDSQKQIEEQLHKINITKDKLFSIIGHDLRGPIGGLMQMLDYINENNNNISSEVIFDFLSKLKFLAKDTYQLLDNLLYWSMSNSNEVNAVPGKLSINQVIEVNLNLNSYLSKNKNLTITSSLDEEYFAFADENMVTLIFRNILSNAMKFTPNNGSIEIKVKKINKFIQISISDTGRGISKENIAKILSEDKFYTSRGTNNEKGSGLGLKLCKNFIKKNDGTFNIESVVGKGSSFIINLPENIKQ